MIGKCDLCEKEIHMMDEHYYTKQNLYCKECLKTDTCISLNKGGIGMTYGDLKDLNKHLLYKRIVEWNENKLVLNDGTIVTLEVSEQDCCASASGTFSNVTLDAVITNVEIGEQVNIPDSDTIVNEVKVTLFHNQNPIALAEMTADAGNGGYYYSIGSFVVNGIHFPIVEA